MRRDLLLPERRHVSGFGHDLDDAQRVGAVKAEGSSDVVKRANLFVF